MYTTQYKKGETQHDNICNERKIGTQKNKFSMKRQKNRRNDNKKSGRNQKDCNKRNRQQTTQQSRKK